MHCSSYCRYEDTGEDRRTSATPISRELSKFIETGKRPQDESGVTITIQSSKPEKKPIKKDAISATKLNLFLPVEFDINEIVNEPTFAEIIGVKKIVSDSSQPKGDIMPETKNSSEAKFLQIAEDENRGAALLGQSICLNEETSQSISSLHSVQNELLRLMKSLNPSRPEDQNEFKVLDQDRVRVATEVGKQFISAMRMKLDLLKFVKEVQDTK